MSFYIRKSVKAGPFRFNLSKSGVGVSAGVPGFRVGTGPRGNYVHVGRHGVYYRATLGAGQGQPSPTQPAASWPQESSSVPMEDVTGSSADALAPTGPGDLIQQLNQAGSRLPISPFAAALALLGFAISPAAGIVVLVFCTPLVAWLVFWDRARRTVVAFYDVNDEAAAWYEQAIAALIAMMATKKTWRINAKGRVRTTAQYKTNSGASSLVSRVPAIANLKGPKRLATNISVPSLTAGGESLYFLPDRVLVRSGRKYSDVAYSGLDLDWSEQRFIESERVPADAVQVDTTWQFVNVKGGPDRRYKNNRQLPVMLYGEFDISSSTGLNWQMQCSRPSSGEQFISMLRSAPSAQVASESAVATT